jgi:hypothetical protein
MKIDPMFGVAAIGVALAVWLVATVSALSALRYRRPERPAIWFLMNGMAFFNARYFLPEAAPYLRRFRWAMIAFVVIVLASIAATFILIGLH